MTRTPVKADGLKAREQRKGMPKKLEQDKAVGLSPTNHPPTEYRPSEGGGTRFRAFLDAAPGRGGVRRQVCIEGRFRKVTPEIEKDVARLLAEALVADYRKRQADGTLDHLPVGKSAPDVDRQTAYTDYVAGRLWAYRTLRFAGRDNLFDQPLRAGSRPPVFKKESGEQNVIVSREPDKAAAVRALVPVKKRHRWFRSMKSSQALALSIFGNLKVLGHADVLQAVSADGFGGPAFGPGPIRSDSILLEHDAKLPGERTSTSVDVLIGGASSVCVECKLTESEVGRCSKTLLPSSNKSHCNGANPMTGGGITCPLANAGPRYWEEVPAFVKMEAWRARRECPMCEPYQLVRNILAASRPGRERGHALLIYDARNPASRPSRNGTFEDLQDVLADPSVLRRCSWQSILAAMMDRPELQGLVQEVGLESGLTPWV